jgi:hypothetical protein
MTLEPNSMPQPGTQLSRVRHRESAKPYEIGRI